MLDSCPFCCGIHSVQAVVHSASKRDAVPVGRWNQTERRALLSLPRRRSTSLTVSGSYRRNYPIIEMIEKSEFGRLYTVINTFLITENKLPESGAETGEPCVRQNTPDARQDSKESRQNQDSKDRKHLFTRPPRFEWRCCLLPLARRPPWPLRLSCCPLRSAEPCAPS